MLAPTPPRSAPGSAVRRTSPAAVHEFVARLDAERVLRHTEWATDLGPTPPEVSSDAAALRDVIDLKPWVELHRAAATWTHAGEEPQEPDEDVALVIEAAAREGPLATNASTALVVELNRIASLSDADALWAEWRGSAVDNDLSQSAFARWLCSGVASGSGLVDSAEGREVASILDLVASMFGVAESGELTRSDIDDGSAFLRQWLCDNSLRDADEPNTSDALNISEDSALVPIDGCIAGADEEVADPSGATKCEAKEQTEADGDASHFVAPQLLPRSANLLVSRDVRFSLWHPDCVAVADVRSQFGNLAAQLLRSEAAAFEDIIGRVVVAPSEPKTARPRDGVDLPPAEHATLSPWGLGIRPSDVVFPVCEDGLYASQALAHVVRTLYPTYRETASTPMSEATYNIDVRPPHGALRGFDPYWRTSTLLTEEESAPERRSRIAPDYTHAPAWPWCGGEAELRAACFARATGGAALEPRAGEAFCTTRGLVIGADPQQPKEWGRLSAGRNAMREFFATSYFAPLSSRPDDVVVEPKAPGVLAEDQSHASRRRIYICLGTSTLAVVLRRLLEVHDASERSDNVVVVCIPFEDRVARAGSEAQLECFGSNVPPATVIESAVTSAINTLRNVILREEQCALPEA